MVFQESLAEVPIYTPSSKTSRHLRRQEGGDATVGRICMWVLVPLWFGILFIHVYEMGMITPPFGLTLFACQAVLPHVDSRAIMLGRVPFIISDVCVLAILISFPQIALFLPGMM